MIYMVVGFAFNEDGQVLLIEKQKPTWQVGQLNGIGGKCEVNETASEAMAREFREETGVTIPPGSWRCFCKLDGKTEGKDWRVFFFATWHPGVRNVRHVEIERPVWIYVDCLPPNVIDNLRWLIPMALASSQVSAVVRELHEVKIPADAAGGDDG